MPCCFLPQHLGAYFSLPACFDLQSPLGSFLYFIQFSVQYSLFLDHFFRNGPWTSLVVQWLRFCASTARAVGLIPGGGSSACCPVKPKKKKRSTSLWGLPGGPVIKTPSLQCKWHGQGTKIPQRLSLPQKYQKTKYNLEMVLSCLINNSVSHLITMSLSWPLGLLNDPVFFSFKLFRTGILPSRTFRTAVGAGGAQWLLVDGLLSFSSTDWLSFDSALSPCPTPSWKWEGCRFLIAVSFVPLIS